MLINGKISTSVSSKPTPHLLFNAEVLREVKKFIQNSLVFIPDEENVIYFHLFIFAIWTKNVLAKFSKFAFSGNLREFVLAKLS